MCRVHTAPCLPFQPLNPPLATLLRFILVSGFFFVTSLARECDVDYEKKRVKLLYFFKLATDEILFFCVFLPPSLHVFSSVEIRSSMKNATGSSVSYNLESMSIA